MAEAEDPEESSNRRQYDRSRLIVDVHFDGAESTGVASTKDISPGGLYMSTQTRIPVGSMLALRIPSAAITSSSRRSRYSNPGEGVGVKFHELSDDTRAHGAGYAAPRAWRSRR